MDSRNGFGKYRTGIICLVIVILLFTCIGSVMGLPNMLNTIMHTAHDLLLNTVFYLMAICVITGALGRIFVEFGVVALLERLLRPLMKPLFNLPGVASLGAVMTFLSDNPAIISLAKDKRFSSYFKKFQFISLTNFGTAFGMGLLVIVFMVSNGYYVEPFIGLIGAFIGCIVSTRLMQRFIIKQYPNFKEEFAEVVAEQEGTQSEEVKETSLFTRILNSLLDGGKTGVDVGLSIIPGVLIISTLVMILTFGPGAEGYTGGAYQGVEFLPWAAGQVNFLFDGLFGFEDPHLIAFPITALGAVGAALGLVPGFIEQGWVDGNAIAVFTAIGMCWSGYLSTHTAMLDALGYRKLTSKAILAHTVGGLVAAISAHWIYLIYTLIFGSPTTNPGFSDIPEVTIKIERIADKEICATVYRGGEYLEGRGFADNKERITDDNSLAYYICDCLDEYVVVRNENAGPKVARFSKVSFVYDEDMDEQMHSMVEASIIKGFNELYLDGVAIKMYHLPLNALRDSKKEQLDQLVRSEHRVEPVSDSYKNDNIVRPEVVEVAPQPEQQKQITNVSNNAPAQNVAATPTVTTNGGEKYHTVKSGDRVVNIAKSYNTTPERIKELNPTIDIDRISIDQRIRVE